MISFKRLRNFVRWILTKEQHWRILAADFQRSTRSDGDRRDFKSIDEVVDSIDSTWLYDDQLGRLNRSTTGYMSFYAHIIIKRCNFKKKPQKTQNSTLLLLPVPEISASQSYLSSCNAQWLSSLFLNEFTEGAVTTENGRLFHTFVILRQNEYFLRL